MGRAVRERLAAATLTLLLVAAGCSYDGGEPGLFGRSPDPDLSSGPAPDPPDSTAPIPLLGQATWVSADVRGIGVRIAVHGVRRVPGGTVLDWSVTALSAPDRVPGAWVEGGLAIDLDEETDVLLIDAPAGRVYRPLTAKDDRRRCLCAPVSLARENLAYDVPRLLQVAYPPLPTDTRVVDVSVSVAPAFSRVPVTPLGQVSAPIAETDLAAPAEPPPVLARTPEFSLVSGQEFAIEVHAVWASGTLTSVVWTLESRSRGPGPSAGLQPTLSRNDAGVASPVAFRGPGTEDASCLCSDPSRWRDHLEEPGRRVTVVTTLGELPRGATTVDVTFPAIPPPGTVPLTDLAVKPASDASFRAAGSVPGPDETWSFRPGRPRAGWPLSAWPTPVPVVPEGQFTATVDRILE